MSFEGVHFAEPIWLWLLSAVPLFLLFMYFGRQKEPQQRLEAFVDAHLLPHLLINSPRKSMSRWKGPLLWSVVWSLLTLAMAGPRWDYREVETYSSDKELVILLDLSRSMDAADLPPSRLVRARRKIEDILDQAEGVKVGLIAFAADPHMIAPLTDDKETLRYLLPSLETDLVHVQGSRLSPALEMAAGLLSGHAGGNRAALVISDGGFEDGSAVAAANRLAEKGIRVYAMGMGTEEGAPVQDREGNFIKRGAGPVLSKLDREKLRDVAKAGGGDYLSPEYASQDEKRLLRDLSGGGGAEVGERTMRLWEERYYLFLLPVIPVLLLWMRNGVIFAALFLFLMPLPDLGAEGIGDYFLNTQQSAMRALESQDYQTAKNIFQDPYRKGVAAYRAGDYAEAESFFRESDREEVALRAAYNRGNALAMQEKFKEAVQAYEEALEMDPDHIPAQENLEIVKKLLEEQEQPDQENNQDRQEGGGDSSSSEQNSEKGNGSDQEGESQQNNDQEQKGEGAKDRSGQEESGNDKSEAESSEEQQEDREVPNEEDSPLDEEHGAPQTEQEPAEGDEQQEISAGKSQEDLDADQWLNRMDSEPKSFFKNKFYIESKRNGTREASDPW